MSNPSLGIVAVALAVCTTSACQRTVAQPAPTQGAGSTAATTVAPAAPATASKHTAADVAFMQGMIAHHAQAIEMVALLKTRTTRDEMKLLGLRIEVSQNDEIATMREWLQARGAAVPDEHALHAHDARLMPGMLTPAQMSQLAAARGMEFDRLFLELMIQHHEGALTMVKELMATPGAAQDSSVFQFVADVEADQSAEINRMRAMRARMKSEVRSEKSEVEVGSGKLEEGGRSEVRGAEEWFA